MLANFSERWEKFEDTQRGNQKFSIEEGQTMWWPKENRTKGQTMINKTLNRKLKVWATRTPLKSAGGSHAKWFVGPYSIYGFWLPSNVSSNFSLRSVKWYVGTLLLK
jgi:hypothetical protein